MSELKQNLEHIQSSLDGSQAKLVAVSKTKPVSLLQEAYDLGVRVFGENKVQEMADKQPQLPEDIHWHMIGHLQTNKVKYLVPFVSMVHSVDRFKVLKEINKRAQKVDRVIDCLLQVHIAEEESKFGLSEEELKEILTSEAFAQMENVRIKGLMGMATNTDNQDQVRKEFRYLKQLFEECKANYSGPNLDFTELSTGMSGDYQIAIEEGSTLVRIGSKIFGARDYANQG